MLQQREKERGTKRERATGLSGGGRARRDLALDPLQLRLSGHIHAELRLEVHPVIRRKPEVARQAERSVRRNRPLSVHDLGQPIDRHPEVALVAWQPGHRQSVIFLPRGTFGQ